MYEIPRLIDVNAKSKLIRDKDKLLIIGRCVEIEHLGILNKYIEQGYAVLSVCLEAEHVNMVGFKLASILARNDFSEVTILTVDGSMHCTQLHWMVEEVFKIMRPASIKRKHIVIYKGRECLIDEKTVKISRFLYRIQKLLRNREDR
ncbi:MAG: 4Fe-4S ferredoxin [Desulfurococcales archaeon ex4484_58]|nr:MAG: 4Fe-4S ferredoxin [Desulfurococcales archaeon ex4484_58]